MKGKYAAKAANRLADLDNELLQQTIAERDSLKAECATLERRLSQLSRDTNAEAMRRAGEIAATEISRLNNLLLKSDSDRDAEVRRIASAIYGLIKEFDIRMPVSAHTRLPEIFRLGAEAGTLTELEGRSRRTRRRSAKQIRAIDSRMAQAKGQGRDLYTPAAQMAGLKKVEGGGYVEEA